MEGRRRSAQCPDESHRPLRRRSLPEIRLTGDGIPGGIVQENLAVVAGKDIHGRLVASADPGPIPLKSLWSGVRLRPTARRFELGTFGPEYRTERFRSRPARRAKAPGSRSRAAASNRSGSETVSLMPADNIEVFRPEVLAVLRELNSPVYRWPEAISSAATTGKTGSESGTKRPAAQESSLAGRGAQ